MSEQESPRLAIRFLSWFCPDALREGIEGDVVEQFASDCKRVGTGRAKGRALWNAFRFFRPGILARNKFTIRFNMLISNYILVALRNISKRKFYSFINAFGLSVGIAFCTLIYLYIRDENSFDQFHQKKDRIYQLVANEFDLSAFQKGSKDPIRHSASMPWALPDVLGSELPQINHLTRFTTREGIMRSGDLKLRQSVTYVDSGFFHMFSFPLIRGRADGIFSNASEAVITPAVATKFFGDADPLGKQFTFGTDNPQSFTVVGIMQAPPPQSSLRFELLLPMQSMPWYKEMHERWNMFSNPVFVELKESASAAGTVEGLGAVISKYMGETIKGWYKDRGVPPGYEVLKLDLVNLTDIHHNTAVSWHKVSNPLYSYILGSIAILIILIACINYVALALTSSQGRTREVGVRKAIGAARPQIGFQFAVESVVLAGFSMIIAIVLVRTFLPSFNEFTGKNIDLLAMNPGGLLAALAGITVLAGLAAGSYPAWYLSGFRPAVVLSGESKTRVQLGLTRSLVLLQFALSAFLVISSVIMFQQMKFVAAKDLGYDREQVLIVPTNAGWTPESDRMVGRIRDVLKQNPRILSVSGTSSAFGDDQWSSYGYDINGETKFAYIYHIDPYYFKTLGIQILQGRNFEEGSAADTLGGIIVNEALVKDMKWTQPLDETLNWRDDKNGKGPRIIGVVKDYNFFSLESKIEPVLLSMDSKAVGEMVNILIKISPEDMPSTIEQIRTAYQQVAPEKPFEYSFLDESVARQYDSYQRWIRIMGLSSLFAILIAALGLFGLAGVNAVNRTREIGIRKVMGASMGNIFVLLNRQYVWMSVVSFAVAAPVSWYVMARWLSSFEFRIQIGWELFAASMAFGLLVALIAVSYHAARAAATNPAETLKYQ